jgi:hypothetical protein
MKFPNYRLVTPELDQFFSRVFVVDPQARASLRDLHNS